MHPVGAYISNRRNLSTFLRYVQLPPCFSRICFLNELKRSVNSANKIIISTKDSNVRPGVGEIYPTI